MGATAFKTLARTNEVEFSGGTVTIHELSLRKIQVLAGVLKEIGSKGSVLANLSSEDPGKLADAVAGLLQDVPDKLVQVVQLAAPDLTEADVLDATPRAVLELLVAIWELNNLGELMRKNAASLLPSGNGGSPRKPPTD